MDRNSVSEKYKWNLDVIYKDSKEFDNTCELVKKEIEEFAGYKDKFMKRKINFDLVKELNNKIRCVKNATSFLCCNGNKMCIIINNIARITSN